MNWIRVAPALYDSVFGDLGSIATTLKPDFVHSMSGFNASTGEFDIAVIASPTAIFTDVMTLGNIPKLPTGIYTVGSIGTIVGFGFTVQGSNAPSSSMYQTSQTIVDSCPTNVAGTETHFCASGTDGNLCPGDNGSGFVVDGVLVC